MEKFKKLLVLLLALTVVFCLAACNKEEPEETEPTLNPGDANCDHSWTDWNVTKENTCTKNGKRERACETCGKQEVEELLAFGHAFYAGVCSTCEKEQKECEHPETYTVTMTEATCETSGESRIVCRLCKGVVRYEYQDPFWHSDCREVIVYEPTCTENGLKHEICNICDQLVYEYTIWANGHGEVEYIVVTEPTCTEDGWYEEICKICGGLYDEGYIWSNGHEYEYIDSKAATCTEIGWSAYRKCTICDYLYNYNERPALGHSFSFGTCNNCGVEDSNFSVLDLSGSTISSMTVPSRESFVYSAQTGVIGVYNGNIADKNAKEIWTLDVTIPGRYFIWLNEIYSGYYMKLYVYNALGERIANDSTIYNNEGLYMDLTTGVYTVEVHYGSGVSTYNINVGFAKATADISAFDTVMDQMEFTRQKIAYTFIPQVSGRYYFGLSEMSGNAAMYMSIYNRLNERITYDSYTVNGEGLSVDLVAGDTYTIYVENSEGFQTTYQLNIGKQQNTVMIDGYNQINDSVYFYGQNNVYQFVATSADIRLEVSNMGASSQVDLYLYNYLNERLVYDTYLNNGEGINYSKLVPGQTYTILVIYRNEPTSYTLSAMTPEETVTVNANSAIIDTMEYYGQVNNYGITATADGELRITLRVDSYAGNRYLSFCVYDANGNKLTSDDYVYDGDYITLKNVTAGTTYYLRVTSYTNNMVYAVEFK